MSNLAVHPGWLARFRDAGYGEQRGRAHEAGMAIRQLGEGAAVGAALGAVAARYGAEVEVADVKVPVDLAVAALGIAAGLVMASSPVASDLRNAGTAGATIYAYRMGMKLAAPAASTIHGELPSNREDPILAASRLLV